MTTYHHGSETVREDGGSVPINTVDGAIIGLIGTAPTGAVNELKLCVTSTNFAQFGGADALDKGYTIPDALDIIGRYKSGQVYVVNVLDPAKHRTTVSSELLAQDIDTLTANTQKSGLIEISISDENGVLVNGQDYTVNMISGEIQFKTKKVGLTASYIYADPTKVTETDIRGAIDTQTGKRTGFQVLFEGFTLFGADAKILICPEFDKTAAMASSLETLAEQLDAETFICAPKGTTLAQALAGRGSEGTINFQSSSKRVNLFYPHVIGERGTLESLATHAAGLRMKTDVENGYWYSISNRPLLGVKGVEVHLYARIDKKESETNLLNARGITTVFNSYGTGFRMWGNRNASFPNNTRISNFEVAHRTGDILDESIRRLALQYADLPVDDVFLDSYLSSIEVYFGTLKSIVGHSVQLDPDVDLVDALSKAQVPLMYDYTPKLPGERFTNRSVMTRKYLVNLARGGK